MFVPLGLQMVAKKAIQVIRRPVAEVFGRVFVLTAVFIKKSYKIRALKERASSGGGGGGLRACPPESFGISKGSEMLFSALCKSIFQTRWSVR